VLTVNGNYVGQNGTIALNTYLGDSTSASDKLVIKGGTGTGITALNVRNVGGQSRMRFADSALPSGRRALSGDT
jgi:outer membrane autotransporter protein